MFFRSPLASFGLRKTVTHVLAILLRMSWPSTVTYVLATDPPDKLLGFARSVTFTNRMLGGAKKCAEPYPGRCS
jgi:hypothetical protein